MPYREIESDVSANESFLSTSVDSDELTQNLLHETSASFEDWLGDLPSTEPLKQTGPAYVPRAPREILFQGTLSVDGYMAGVVRSEHGTLIVTEAGEIDGDVYVDVAMVSGFIRGDIRAATQVEIAAAGKVIGDIETLKLTILPGAVFEGRCSLLPVPDKSAPTDGAQADAGDGDDLMMTAAS